MNIQQCETCKFMIDDGSTPPKCRIILFRVEKDEKATICHVSPTNCIDARKICDYYRNSNKREGVTNELYS
jgi:hypothetical protein